MIYLKKSVDPSFAMPREKIVRFFSSLLSLTWRFSMQLNLLPMNGTK